MQYFRLASDCFLVEGAREAALYDVHGCRVLLLDNEAHRLLRRCENNEPLDSALAEAGLALLKKLSRAGLGFFGTAPVYVDKLLLNQPLDWKGMCMLPPAFLRADWSITNGCDLDCSFCGRAGATVCWQACQTCIRHNRLAGNEWTPNVEEFVATTARLGVRVLHIRGGNPLLAWNRLISIVRAVHATRLELVVTTPGTGRQIEDVLSLYSAGRICLNVVMFGIDGNQELAHQIALVDALAAARLPFFLTFLLTAGTQSDRSRILDFVDKRWNGVPSFAEIYLRDEMEPGLRFSHVGKHTKPLTPWQSAQNFFFRVRHHSCTFGNFEVGADGQLRCCAGLHQVHGDIRNVGLLPALARNGLYEMWDITKASIQPCARCVLRYACADCCAVELEGQKNAEIKEAYCPHDPWGRRRAAQSAWYPPGFITTGVRKVRSRSRAPARPSRKNDNETQHRKDGIRRCLSGNG